MRLAFVAALLFVAAPAVAKEGDKVYGTSAPPEFGVNPAPDYHSSQYFAAELKMGSYSPDIDSSPGLHGAHPFADLFNPQGKTGKPQGRLLTSIELDVQFLHKYGSLGIGTSVGYYRRTTHSFQYPGGEPNVMDGKFVTCMVPNCQRSGDQTALNIIPLEAMVVYRFDVLALRYHIPLVPYMKVGLAYYIWIIENGGGAGSISTYLAPTTPPAPPNTSGPRGFGGTFGFVLNPGLSFLLDVIDPTAAKTIDAELGINHSYIFAELHYANITGFGASNKMDLSDVSWNVGLAFEF